MPKPEISPEFFSPEEKEKKKELNLDTVIVFGQGPVKSVILENELTEEQRNKWREFKKDPLHQEEPDFRVLEGKAYIDTLEAINSRDDVSREEKERLKMQKRIEWQRTGRLAVNRWCRTNALAAGAALLEGKTSQIIFSGGKTQPGWAKERLPKEILDNWPSEAEMMRDIVIRVFGGEYQKRYEKQIKEALSLEDTSTNTLENFGYTIKNHPELLKDKRFGLLATDFHIQRVVILSHLFSAWEQPGAQFSAQEILRERAERRKKGFYSSMMRYMKDPQRNPDLVKRIKGEMQWTGGLIEPKLLSYWLGYIGDSENAVAIQNVLDMLKNKEWAEAAKREFSQVGLDFDDFKNEDIVKLQQKNPEKFKGLLEGFKGLKKEFRKMPAPVDIREK